MRHGNHTARRPAQLAVDRTQVRGVDGARPWQPSVTASRRTVSRSAHGVLLVAEGSSAPCRLVHRASYQACAGGGVLGMV